MRVLPRSPGFLVDYPAELAIRATTTSPGLPAQLCGNTEILLRDFEDSSVAKMTT